MGIVRVISTGSAAHVMFEAFNTPLFGYLSDRLGRRKAETEVSLVWLCCYALLCGSVCIYAKCTHDLSLDERFWCYVWIWSKRILFLTCYLDSGS